MRLFTDPKLRITVEEFNGNYYIKEVWRGVFNQEVFRDLIDQSLAIYAREVSKYKSFERGKFLLFADVTELEMIRPEEITWLDTEINPKYERLGFTHQIVIEPKTQLASDKVQEYNTLDEKAIFVTKVFSNHKDGLKWFFEQNQ